jgi:hypothetical protein
MSRSQLSRTPENFPRMKHRAAGRLAPKDELETMRALIDVIRKAFGPIADAFAELAKVIAPMHQQLQKDFALVPAQNLPHDPTLLKDRRKWGGK